MPGWVPVNVLGGLTLPGQSCAWHWRTASGTLQEYTIQSASAFPARKRGRKRRQIKFSCQRGCIRVLPHVLA